MIIPAKNYSGLIVRDREASMELSTWVTYVRILFVIDGRITLGMGSEEFGLGFVLDTLRSTPLENWVRFSVDVARRDGEIKVNPSPGPYEEHYTGFRFYQEGFRLDHYDQVWFYGDNPGPCSEGGPSPDENPCPENPMDPYYYARTQFSPLEHEERRIIAKWMDRGGGVFATGDHGLLGASMCWGIPRVRTMRKWLHTQNVPEKRDYTTNATIQGDFNDLNAEGDALPQPIEPVFRKIYSTPFGFGFFELLPHPILSSGVTVIDKFPDHMHEGEVIADEAVEFDKPLDITGYNRPEYPESPQIFAPPTDPGIPTPFPRPRPQVIAYGRTTNYARKGVNILMLNTTSVNSIRFPLIGVYDGDPVKIGRVVVDSTWHHWFSLNLIGFKTNNIPVYEHMQAYYRNVALWLTRPNQRSSMLFSAVWNQLILSAPMNFQGEMSPWEVGTKINKALEQETSTSMVTEMVASFLEPGTLNLSYIQRGVNEFIPSWSHLSWGLTNNAIIGGIGNSLRKVSLSLQQPQSVGRKFELNPDNLLKHAMKGAAEGFQLLVNTLDTATQESSDLHKKIKDKFQVISSDSLPQPLANVHLSIVPTGLQFPDASDPALKNGPLSITIRIALKGIVIAAQIIRDLNIPAFKKDGAFIDLNVKPFFFQVQQSEKLTIEVLIGDWWLEDAQKEFLRFEEILEGNPFTWIGNHQPALSQSWRLWYQIGMEKTGA